MITALAFGTTMSNGGEVGVDIAFAIACSVWGYQLSKRHRTVRGVTPWRLPSVAWAIICLILQPFGIIMELVAEFTTRPVVPSPTGEVVSNFRSYPPPTQAPQNQPALIAPVEPVVSKYPAPNDGSGKPALFGWYSDPLQRHGHRYWDGRSWSDQVADDGAITVDPLP